jgi:hypothetical protein
MRLQTGSECEERFMDVVVTLIPNQQATKAMQPRQLALGDPPVPPSVRVVVASSKAAELNVGGG